LHGVVFDILGATGLVAVRLAYRAVARGRARSRHKLCRHHPRKRMIQYSRDVTIDREAAAYWIAPPSLVKPGDDS